MWGINAPLVLLLLISGRVDKASATEMQDLGSIPGRVFLL